MARLTVPAPNFYASESEPTALTRFIRVNTAVSSGTTLNTTGRDAIDVWACLLARCKEWDLAYSGSGSGSGGGNSWTVAYSGTTTMNVPAFSTPGYLAHPEVATAAHTFQSTGSGIISNVGTWTETGGLGSGAWDAQCEMNFAPAQDDDEDGVPYAGPVCVGSTLFIPFKITLEMSTNGGSLGTGNSVLNHVLRTYNYTGDPQCGTLTINVPNWRSGGTTSLTMPLHCSDYPPAFPTAHTFNATLSPASGSYLLYGSGNANENPRWNADGSVNGTPGD